MNKPLTHTAYEKGTHLYHALRIQDSSKFFQTKLLYAIPLQDDPSEAWLESYPADKQVSKEVAAEALEQVAKAEEALRQSLGIGRTRAETPSADAVATGHDLQQNAQETPERSHELRDLLRCFIANKRFHFNPRERFVVLKRWGIVSTPSFEHFSDAVTFTQGFLHAPQEHAACAFVLDTDPEFATATLITPQGTGPTQDIKEEIWQLYDGVFDGKEYASKLIQRREQERQLASEREISNREAERQLLILAFVAVVLIFIFFRW